MNLDIFTKKCTGLFWKGQEVHLNLACEAYFLKWITNLYKSSFPYDLSIHVPKELVNIILSYSAPHYENKQLHNVPNHVLKGINKFSFSYTTQGSYFDDGRIQDPNHRQEHTHLPSQYGILPSQSI